MSLSWRILLTYTLIFCVVSYQLWTVFTHELKPALRQATEDVLVETANILAELATPELLTGTHDFKQFEYSFKRFQSRSYTAQIFEVNKTQTSLNVYITDVQGKVIYDSEHKVVGQDYSQWNNILLTLKGHYGARSTASDPHDETSSVMHVSAPMSHNGHIVGVLTVTKPNTSVQPFLDTIKEKVKQQGLLLIVFALLITIILAFWLTRSIRKISHYADLVAQGKKSELPVIAETELANLVISIAHMRETIEGKDYVEKYVHALTHELKSPMTAIKGAAEIINQQMDNKDFECFISNIQNDVTRINEMINRLLALAAIEKSDAIQQLERVDLVPMIQAVIDTKQLNADKNNITLMFESETSIALKCDPFLLAQVFDNLVQNALDFSDEGSVINIKVEKNAQHSVCIEIKDQGAGIPNYAMDKVFDRFYSLPRPNSGRKSSGLGLCFVAQIMALHGGKISLENHSNGGVIAQIIVPLSE